ncbi:MAG: SpaA isopeptide-forming pilin-related protein [Defluviitaleaceae bacterium]|nr:SpaA isopeptide-forming pilin-related protein [Defluviitaleaceae bacterium]
MRLLKQQVRSSIKPFLAMFMAFLTAFGAMPLSVFANTGRLREYESIAEAEPFYARIDGEDVLVAADGLADALEMEIPRYIYFDGVQIPVDDDRIEGLTPVVAPVAPFAALSADNNNDEVTPFISFIVSMSGALPSNPVVGQIGQEYTHPAYVTMNSQIVSSRRYAVQINGVFYEAFCADPNLPGPGQAGAVYAMTETDGSQFRTVLRYGFPINPALSYGLSGDARSWNAYMTRVAVAYISRPNATWGGLVGETQVAVNDRVTGAGGAAAKANAPAISVNGETDDSQFGYEPQSPVFTLGHSRRTNCRRNPFRFEWAQGTPVGTRLYVNNTFVAESTSSLGQIDQIFFTVEEASGHYAWIEAENFHFVMPQGSEGQTASVNLVGINNQYAGRVFVMQNPNNTAGWQDIIFYVPELLASAAYTWSYTPGEDPGNLRITKRSAVDGSTLAGAVFRITGPYGFDETHTTPESGVIELTNLTPGSYTITEITPPPGYVLSSPTTQTVMVLPNSTAWASVDFVNPRNGNGNGNGNGSVPRPSVRIQKICALGRYNIPDALVRIEGRSAFYVTAGDGQVWAINNTGVDISVVMTAGHTLPVVEEPTYENPYPMWFQLEDGILTIHNIPWGYFRVQEERAPDGYSLLPQHTAYSFWVLPPDVTVDVAGYDDTGSPIFEFNEYGNVNSILVTLENYPFSEIIAYKHCRETLVPLAGAHIRIEGFFVEGNAPVITDRTYVTDADGRVIFTNLPAGTYTISEVQAPPGFMLDEPNFHSVNVSWGQRRFNALGQPVTAREVPVVRFYNTPMSYLLVEKIDGDTGAPLDGAIFRVEGVDQFGVRTTWYATSENGVARFDGLFTPGETYIITEVQAPDGYVLMEGPLYHVMSYGRNTIVWRNWINPGLTIIKQCLDTGERLPGAEFSIVAQGSGSPLPTDFPMITNANGEIHIPWTLFEGEAERTFIVTEVVPPPGFHLADPNWQVVTMIAGYHNTVLFQNRRMPDLTIIKRDQRTNEAIEGAEFTIYKITEPGRGYITDNPFITDSSGRIHLQGLHYGRYRVVETRAAQNYFLDPLEQNRSWIIEIRPNEDYVLSVFNTLLPSLVITKWNMLTMRPVPMTHFRVEFEVPNSANVVEIGRFVTDSNGQIILPFVDVGWYRITEIFPAPGMALNVNNQAILGVEEPAPEFVRTHAIMTLILVGGGKGLLIGLILALVFVIVVGWNYFKLIVECVERYFVVGILAFASPLAFAMGPSQATNPIFKSWCRMLGGQLLLLIMNVWTLRMFITMLRVFIANPVMSFA